MWLRDIEAYFITLRAVQVLLLNGLPSLTNNNSSVRALVFAHLLRRAEPKSGSFVFVLVPMK